MSATLAEVEQLASWMDAVVYRSCFRPIRLRETILVDGHLCDVATMRRVEDEAIVEIPGDSQHVIA